MATSKLLERQKINRCRIHKIRSNLARIVAAHTHTHSSKRIDILFIYTSLASNVHNYGWCHSNARTDPQQADKTHTPPHNHSILNGTVTYKAWNNNNNNWVVRLLDVAGEWSECSHCVCVRARVHIKKWFLVYFIRSGSLEIYHLVW